MRVSSATRAVVVLALVSVCGCSIPKPSMPKFMDKLSFKSKKSDATASNSALATAPPAAPGFNGNTAAPPAVSMAGAVPSSGNLPVYPGTNYPVTPYPSAPANTVAASGYAPGEVTPTAGYAPAPNGYAPAANAYAAPPAPQYAAPPAQQYYNPTGGYNAAAPSDTTIR